MVDGIHQNWKLKIDRLVLPTRCWIVLSVLVQNVIDEPKACGDIKRTISEYDNRRKVLIHKKNKQQEMSRNYNRDFRKDKNPVSTTLQTGIEVLSTYHRSET